MNANDARRTELRRHRAATAAARAHLARTPAEAAYCEACFDIAWEYGEQTPLEAACDALRDGDRTAMEQALADDARLDTLARAARPTR